MAGQETVSGLGDRLRAARELADMTQADVAALAGISRSQVANMERGHAEPSLSSLVGLATAVGVAVGALLGETPMPELPTVRIETKCVVNCARCGPVAESDSIAEAQKARNVHRHQHLAG